MTSIGRIQPIAPVSPVRLDKQREKPPHLSKEGKRRDGASFDSYLIMNIESNLIEHVSHDVIVPSFKNTRILSDLNRKTCL